MKENWQNSELLEKKEGDKFFMNKSFLKNEIYISFFFMILRACSQSSFQLKFPYFCHKLFKFRQNISIFFFNFHNVCLKKMKILTRKQDYEQALITLIIYLKISFISYVEMQIIRAEIVKYTF